MKNVVENSFSHKIHTHTIREEKKKPFVHSMDIWHETDITFL